MVLDQCNLYRNEQPKIYSVVTIDSDNKMRVKKGYTMSKAYAEFESLKASGVQAIVVVSTEIRKRNINV